VSNREAIEDESGAGARESCVAWGATAAPLIAGTLLRSSVLGAASDCGWAR
jgi:hypothetical protein